MREVVLIGNPVAGGNASRKIESAASLIRKKGVDVRVLLTGKRGDAEAYARGISKKYGATPSYNLHTSPLVIAAGGDGTYNEVANGLAYSGVPMAVLPLGTTSVLAKELSIPHDIAACVDIALDGKVETIHLGKIAFHPPAPHLDKERGRGWDLQPSPRYFLLMAGIGFDGETIFALSEKTKKHAGKVAYILSGIRTVLSYRPVLLTVKYRESLACRKEKGIQGYAVIISKASCYGGAFKIAPDARLIDPSFSVFMTHRKGRLDLLRYAWGIVTGRHLRYQDIGYFRAVELSVEGDAHIQIDGDYAGMTPARIEIARDALRLVTGG